MAKATPNAIQDDDDPSLTAANDDGSEPADNEGLFRSLKAKVLKDIEKWRPWQRKVRYWRGFVAGHQWSTEDKELLREQGRPEVTFNRTAPTIDSIVGIEIGNRREVQYIPRSIGDAAKNEVFTAAGDFFRDECEAEDEESEAFWETVVSGLSCVDTRLSYEVDDEGSAIVENIDILEMFPDHKAVKANLVDARRASRIRKMTVGDARALLASVAPDAVFTASQMNAGWANVGASAEEGHSADKRDAYNQGDLVNSPDDDDYDDDDEITLCHTQWWENVTRYKVALGGELKTIDESQYQALNAKLQASMPGFGEFKAVKIPGRAFKQAFLGTEILWTGPCACPTHFSWQFITGKRDKKDGTFYGIVAPMVDPQMWANKWLSQGMHIMNTTARSGYFAEEGVFTDPRKAEESIAQTGTITEVAMGALSGGRLEPKQSAGFPQDMSNLMAFAISSTRDVSGVNLELLGLKDNEQAGVLEAQRKQAGMTILAAFFNSLRRYRKRQGKIMLYYIMNDLADGRLIRIVGEEGAQYVPLTHEPGTEKYDVIVDDAPTSPNQKEQVWQTFVQMLPFIGKALGPDEMLAMAKYSPMPTSVVQELAQKRNQSQQQNAPKQQAAEQLAFQEQQAKVRELNARADRAQAEAHRAAVETGMQPPQYQNPDELRKASADADKAEADAMKAAAEAYMAMIATPPDAEVEDPEMGAKERDMINGLAQQLGMIGQAMQTLHSAHQNSMKAMTEDVGALHQKFEAANAPATIERDEQGAPVSVVKNGVRRAIQRDADGRIIGI
jgi:hypothetical protein